MNSGSVPFTEPWLIHPIIWCPREACNIELGDKYLIYQDLTWAFFPELWSNEIRQKRWDGPSPKGGVLIATICKVLISSFSWFKTSFSRSAVSVPPLRPFNAQIHRFQAKAELPDRFPLTVSFHSQPHPHLYPLYFFLSQARASRNYATLPHSGKNCFRAVFFKAVLLVLWSNKPISWKTGNLHLRTHFSLSEYTPAIPI